MLFFFFGFFLVDTLRWNWLFFSPQTSAEHLWKGELLLSLTRIFVRKSYKEVFFYFFIITALFDFTAAVYSSKNHQPGQKRGITLKL